jgi:hypothetical protein
MEYEAVCHRLCDDISHLLLDGPRPPVLRVAYAAGRATQDLAAAFHRAAGHPADQLWSDAVESTAHFLDVCDESMVASTAELRELRRFVFENADALQPGFELKMAS